MINRFNGTVSLYLKILVAVVIGMFAFTGLALADTNSALIAPLCNGISLITGTIGKPIAVIILIMLAILMLIGKATVGLFIATAIGMTIMFSAVSLVTLLTQDNSNSSSSSSTATTICPPS